MKNCPTCDLDFEDEFIFCTEDGSRLEYLVDVPRPQAISKLPDSSAIKPAMVSALHCPACQGEYPLTFVVCPLDGLLLRREKLSAPEKKVLPIVEPAVVKPTVAEPMTVEMMALEPPIVGPTILIPPQPSNERMFAHMSEPQETAALPLLIAEDIRRVTIRQAAETVYDEMAGAVSRIKSRLSSLRDQASKAREGVDRKQIEKTEPPNLRVAARVTIIGLSLFALLALYAAYDYVARRPSAKPSVEKMAETAEVSPLIPTPEEARNYREEPADETSSVIAESSAGESAAAPPRHSSVTKQLLSNAERQPKAPEPAPRPATAPVVTGPVPSQSTGGRINARLLRVRASKARPGVRYDLTFVLNEEAGDSVRWERMVISTRSAKGLNQTQTIPFRHRLGADGSLTFTVSVQMFGPSEADLRGRIVCTTIGADPSGRTMRASFGANVAP